MFKLINPKVHQKKILYISFFLFLSINFGAIFLSWQGRSLPPEPDDTGAMLFFITANKDYVSTFSTKLKIFDRPYYWNADNGLDRLNYFSWSLLWGKIAKLFSLQPIVALKLSFYFGIFLFLVSSLYFFKEKDRKFKIILIATLAFFTGDGTYHGLYWPASSLYSVSLFLLILKLIFENKKYLSVKLLFILPFYLLIHPLSLISLFSLPIFVFFNFLFKNRNIELQKRLLIIFIVSISFYFSFYKILSILGISLLKNTDLIHAVISNLLSGKSSLSPQSLPIIIDKYFIYIFTRPFFLTLLVLGLLKSYRNDKKIFILITSFIPLILLGTLFNGGERILLHTWVLTFFIFTFGLVNLLGIVKKLIDNSLNVSIRKKLVFLLLINIILEIIFTLFFIKLDCMKNIILKYFFIWSSILLCIFVGLGWVFKKKLILILVFFSLLNFYIFLGLEKAATIVFQRRNNDVVFNKNLFIPRIRKDGIIIYNDNLSFALFSSNGLLEREAVKKGSLKKNDLAKSAYFIARKPIDCQLEKCFLEEQGEKRQMQRIAMDDYFLLYEF